MSNPPQDPRNPEEQPQHGQNRPAAPSAGPTPEQDAPAPGQQPPPAPEQPAQAGQQPAPNQPAPSQPWQPPAQPPRPQYGEMAPGQQPGQQPGQPYGSPTYGAQPAGQQPQSPYSYQAAQPSAYGYPGGGSQVQNLHGPIAAPKEVLISFWLLIAAAVLTAITTIAVLATIGSSESLAELDAMFAQQETEVPMNAEALVGIAAVFIAVVAVVGIVIYVLLAFLIKKGKNWARITGTVLAVLSLLTLIGAGWLWILTVLLGVAAIVLLFMPASNNFFSAHKARKQGAFGR